MKTEHDHDHGDIEEHDLGLHHDLTKLAALNSRFPLLGRRQALGLFAGAGLVALVGCSSSTKQTASSATASASTSTSTSTSAAASSSASAAAPSEEIPEETGGPYPGDGSNGPNALTTSGIVRKDLRKSFGLASGTASGVPVTVRLTLFDTSGKTMPGAAVYLWHCDAEGRYSMYDSEIVNENYLRGVQAADSDGVVTFTSIFPAAYSGRWPHMHFEIFESLSAATSASSKLRTSQLALPKDVCETVYATSGYPNSASNLAQTSLTSDNVFSDDGAAHQLATATGSVSKGYDIALAVTV